MILVYIYIYIYIYIYSFFFLGLKREKVNIFKRDLYSFENHSFSSYKCFQFLELLMSFPVWSLVYSVVTVLIGWLFLLFPGRFWLSLSLSLFFSLSSSPSLSNSVLCALPRWITLFLQLVSDI